MKKIALYMMFICLVISCEKQTETPTITPEINLSIDDQNYVVNDSFPKGDIRRYGIYPNQPIIQKLVTKLIILSSKGLPITFPKGMYETSLVFDDVSNVNLIFQEAIIGGAINILDGSNKLKFDGQLTILDKLFIRKSNNIQFDTLIVKSDTVLNMYRKKNRGVSIYSGSKKITFKSLVINNTGGASDEFYTHSAAALQVHGWNNNPEQVFINELKISDVARTALYLTGTGHQIKKIEITNFGIGSSANMFGLEDASPGEEKEFVGAWLNRCNDCEIDSLSINVTKTNGAFSLRLDEGIYHEPSFINNIHFINNAKDMIIKDDVLTNILVKNEY
jgi:hypothetical protein